MSKTIAYAGALAAAMLVASTGTAAAQSADLLGAVGSDSGSLSASSETEGDYLGEIGDMAPASVTGSLPGYATGPLGSTAALACNVGSAAGLAANVTGVPLPLPISGICSFLSPLAKAGDALLGGDAQGSVDAVIGGIPIVGTLITKSMDTSSVTEQVEGSIGDQLGSLQESSLSPAN